MANISPASSAAGPSQLSQPSQPHQKKGPTANGTYYAPSYGQQPGPQASSQQSSSSSYPSQSQQYYNGTYPAPAWQQTAWQLPGHAHNRPVSYQPQHSYSQMAYQQYQPQAPQASRYSSQAVISSTSQSQKNAKVKPQPRVRTPTPSPPPPEFHRHWDSVISSFLSGLGLMQALRGFENDLLVMNEDWERQKVPKAIGELMRDLMSLGQSPNIDRKERSLDDRKLEYAQFAKGVEPRSQTSINKSISQFLAQNRARNDASNRAEFLQSLTEKRLKIDSGTENPEDFAEPSSCARVDAKPLDRDVQMKYDIAKNDEGPLRRTIKSEITSQAVGDTKGKQKQSSVDGYEHTPERHPGLDQRLGHLETHLSMRYVPSPPRLLLDRIKFVEDRIIQLEKEYPPWAALHFNQPHRGWPAPPRPTPVIVPSHLTSTAAPSIAHPLPKTPAQSSQEGKGKIKNTKSSLQRAVLEKLEVQNAIKDLHGGRERA